MYQKDCGGFSQGRSQDAAPAEHGTLTVRPRTSGEYQQRRGFFRIQIRTFVYWLRRMEKERWPPLLIRRLSRAGVARGAGGPASALEEQHISGLLDVHLLAPLHVRRTANECVFFASREKYVVMACGGFSPQGSYWAIDTNPKEDTVPSRPKKRPRSGERVNLNLSLFLSFFLVLHREQR